MRQKQGASGASEQGASGASEPVILPHAAQPQITLSSLLPHRMASKPHWETQEAGHLRKLGAFHFHQTTTMLHSVEHHTSNALS